MVIFIIGGGGVLGRHLGYHLACQHHEVHLFDIDTVDINTSIIPKGHIHTLKREHTFEALEHFVRRKSPKVIFHLAENTNIDAYNNIHTIHDNVGLTSDVLHLCARYNVRGIIGTWEAIENRDESLLVHSLRQKEDLVSFFHRGNTVVNLVRIPQLVHPDYPGTKFGAILNRLNYHIEYDQPFYLGSKSENFRGPRRFNLLSPVISDLIKIMHRNTRNTIDIDGHRFSFEPLIRFALHAHNVNSVELVSQGEPLEFTRAICDEEHPIYQWIANQPWRGSEEASRRDVSIDLQR